MTIQSLKQYFTLIKFSHSVFALPFALISAILAIRANSQPYFAEESLYTFIWVILAMVGARSGAMGFNRLVDRKWDKENPRTANRPSVTGEIGAFPMALLIVISYALLVFSAWKLNPLAFYLSPLAILLVSGYSFTKRFTSFSHYFLGIAIGSAPVASWIAVTGEISLISVLIGSSVMTWIAGFDILYALQDLEYDRKAELNSFPVRFGIGGSLLAAKLSHSISVICWFLLWRVADLKPIFLIGIIICSGLMIREHRLLKRDDLSKLDIAFFNMNALISMVLFASLIADLLIQL